MQNGVAQFCCTNARPQITFACMQEWCWWCLCKENEIGAHDDSDREIVRRGQRGRSAASFCLIVACCRKRSKFWSWQTFDRLIFANVWPLDLGGRQDKIVDPLHDWRQAFVPSLDGVRLCHQDRRCHQWLFSINRRNNYLRYGFLRNFTYVPAFVLIVTAGTPCRLWARADWPRKYPGPIGPEAKNAWLFLAVYYLPYIMFSSLFFNFLFFYVGKTLNPYPI